MNMKNIHDLPVELIGVIGSFLQPKDYYLWISTNKIWWETYGGVEDVDNIRSVRFYKRMLTREIFTGKSEKDILMTKLQKFCDDHDLYLTGRFIAEQFLGDRMQSSEHFDLKDQFVMTDSDQLDIIIAIPCIFPEEGIKKINDILGITINPEIFSEKLKEREIVSYYCRLPIGFEIGIFRMYDAETGKDSVNILCNNSLFPTRFVGYYKGQFRFDKILMRKHYYFRKIYIDKEIVPDVEKLISISIVDAGGADRQKILTHFKYLIRTLNAMCKMKMEIREGIDLFKKLYTKQQSFTIQLLPESNTVIFNFWYHKKSYKNFISDNLYKKIKKIVVACVE